MTTLTSSDYFDAMLYGVPDEQKVSRFREATARVAAYIPQHFQQVHQQVVNTVDRLSNLNYRNAMKVATAHIQSAWVGDYIRPLEELADIQAACPVMQRYIMAEPTYRALYNQGQAHGYGKDYVDMQPGALKNNHTDYQRVVHGLWIDDEDTGMSEQCVYHTDISNDDDEDDLQLSQQLAITSTWLTARYESEQKRFDIGCQLGGSL